MWLNSVSLGRFEVAGWGGCGGCHDGWASLMNVQAVDVCGNDGGDADLCVPCNTPKKQFTKQVPKKWY